ncbi:hypothetical protein FN846DRAFT_755643, partial [Sphaerosporella brunnea]
EAKREGDVSRACGQLLGYMACVHASRVAAGRTDTTVYGVATDGFEYRFLSIDPQKVFRMGGLVDLQFGDL